MIITVQEKWDIAVHWLDVDFDIAMLMARELARGFPYLARRPGNHSNVLAFYEAMHEHGLW